MDPPSRFTKQKPAENPPVGVYTVPRAFISISQNDSLRRHYPNQVQGLKALAAFSQPELSSTPYSVLQYYYIR